MIPAHQNKSVVIDVIVKEKDTAKNITGGAVRAVIISPSGGKKAITSAITDATGGVVQLTVENGVLDVDGEWLAELAVVIGSDDRTVWQEPVLAARSFT